MSDGSCQRVGWCVKQGLKRTLAASEVGSQRPPCATTAIFMQLRKSSENKGLFSAKKKHNRHYRTLRGRLRVACRQSWSWESKLLRQFERATVRQAIRLTVWRTITSRSIANSRSQRVVSRCYRIRSEEGALAGTSNPLRERRILPRWLQIRLLQRRPYGGTFRSGGRRVLLAGFDADL